MEIRRYSDSDDAQLFGIMREEGPDWECYYGTDSAGNYKKAMEASETYVAYEEGVLCGYIRSRDDSGLGLYIYDLLVSKSFRGRGIGRMLMEHASSCYGGEAVYVMSGADGYYEKQGYLREGSIFRIRA